MLPQGLLIRTYFLVCLSIAAALMEGCGEGVQPKPPPQETVKLSPEQELATLTKNAEAGDANAQYTLGKIYATGEGAPKDDVKSVEWYQKAAERGSNDARYELGRCYYGGRCGLTKDDAKAHEFVQRAADEGHAEAQYLLGGMYDFVEYLYGPVDRGDRRASHDLPLPYHLGLATKEARADAGNQARKWFRKAAEQGHVDAQAYLGMIYGLGKGVPKDHAEALVWNRKAADQGDVGAQASLRDMYLFGRGVPKDYGKAVEWYRKAAAQGSFGGQYNLGLLYAQGDGVPKDLVLAYAWFNLASASISYIEKFYYGDSPATNLRITESLLSKADLAEAQRLSSNWKKGQILSRDGTAVADPAQAAASGVLSKKGTGTMFLVSRNGHAITNQHVTGGCIELRIQGRNELARLVTEDTVNDLALLQLPGGVTDNAAIASEPGKLRQGEDIVAFGFPLNTLLSSGGNLTPGVVSALTGLGNNTNQIQITAPIQPGSSGSPVLNKKGEVVGVVSMKLDDGKMAKVTGQIGQNVNFAVSGQTLKSFLDTHKVTYTSGSGFFSREKGTADLADEARKWTLVVECWK